jgi:hypothetical protein
MKILFGLALIALATRCGPVPPDERVFPAGRYAYEARYLPPESADSVTRTGVLVLSEVTPDSLVGHWEVEGYDEKFVEAYHNVVSFYLISHAENGADSVLVTHYIRGDGDEPALGCRVAVTRPGYLEDGRCSLRRLGT